MLRLTYVAIGRIYTTHAIQPKKAVISHLLNRQWTCPWYLRMSDTGRNMCQRWRRDVIKNISVDVGHINVSATMSGSLSQRHRPTLAMWSFNR